jgi:phosphomannomutase
MSKNKIDLQEGLSVEKIVAALKNKYSDKPMSTIDGLKIEFDKSWVHLRPSNTEPIIRVYSEASSEEEASALANQIIQDALSVS